MGTTEEKRTPDAGRPRGREMRVDDTPWENQRRVKKAAVEPIRQQQRRRRKRDKLKRRRQEITKEAAAEESQGAKQQRRAHGMQLERPVEAIKK